MGSGDDSSFSDGSGSDNGDEASSATTPTSDILLSSSNSDEGKIENTIFGGESTGEPATAILSLNKYRNSKWLEIDRFSDGDPGLGGSVTEDRCHYMGNIEDKADSSGAEDGQAEDRSKEVDHDSNRAGDEDGVEYGRDDIIVDLERNGIEVDWDESHNKHGHRAGSGDDGEGRCYLFPSSY